MVESRRVTLLDLSVFPDIVELRPYEMLLDHVVLLVKGVALRSIFLEEGLLLVGVEEGHDDVEAGEDHDVDAFVEELLFGVGLGDGYSCSKDGST